MPSISLVSNAQIEFHNNGNFKNNFSGQIEKHQEEKNFHEHSKQIFPAYLHSQHERKDAKRASIAKITRNVH